MTHLSTEENVFIRMALEDAIRKYDSNAHERPHTRQAEYWAEEARKAEALLAKIVIGCKITITPP
jgi:hypothetical protein